MSCITRRTFKTVPVVVLSLGLSSWKRCSFWHKCLWFVCFFCVCVGGSLKFLQIIISTSIWAVVQTCVSHLVLSVPITPRTLLANLQKLLQFLPKVILFFRIIRKKTLAILNTVDCGETCSAPQLLRKTFIEGYDPLPGFHRHGILSHINALYVEKLTCVYLDVQL